MEDKEATNFIEFENNTWPIAVGNFAKYVCKTDLYLDSNKATFINIECLDGNTFDWPDPWPNCVTHIECTEEPPPKPGDRMKYNYKPSQTYKNDEKIT